MKPLPGPVEDVTDARGSGTILAVAAMATGSLIVAVLLLCIIVYRDKEKGQSLLISMPMTLCLRKRYTCQHIIILSIINPLLINRFFLKLIKSSF